MFGFFLVALVGFLSPGSKTSSGKSKLAKPRLSVSTAEGLNAYFRVVDTVRSLTSTEKPGHETQMSRKFLICVEIKISFAASAKEMLAWYIDVRETYFV